MKKTLFITLCIMMLCTTVTFASDTEAHGEKLTLTQFLDVSREDAESVAITITMYDTDFETAYVDKNAFYDISDSFMLIPISEPEPLTWEGIYITVKKTDGSLSSAFIEQWGFADRYGLSMSGVPHGLYKAEDYLKVPELIALGKPEITVNEELDININGRKADLTLKPFVDENGRTLVPAREFCSLIRKSISWADDPARIVIYPHSDTADNDMNRSDCVIFRIGERSYEINGRLREIDTSAQLIGGNAYVPLRALAELLGYSVVYAPASDNAGC